MSFVVTRTESICVFLLQYVAVALLVIIVRPRVIVLKIQVVTVKQENVILVYVNLGACDQGLHFCAVFNLIYR